MNRRARATIVVSLTATLAGALGVTSAAASPADQPTNKLDSFTEQQAERERELEEFNRTGVSGPANPDWPGVENGLGVPATVQQLANTLAGSYGSDSYGATQWVAESSNAVVWWHGAVPEDVTYEIAEASASVGIEVREMAHSAAELAEAAQEILEHSDKAELGINSVSAKFDGSGLVAGFATEAQLNDMAAARRAAGSAFLGTTKDYPVEFEFSGEIEQSADSRLTPSAPYAAGTRIYSPGTGTSCTSAFSVKIYNPNPARPKPIGALTAHHCGLWGPGTWGTATNYFFGFKASEYSSSQRDAAVMVNDPVTSGVADNLLLYYPQVYMGPYNEGSARYVVTGGVAPVIGAQWCTSGSYSGTVCGNQVTETNRWVNYGSGPHTSYGPMVTTVQMAGVPAAGNGDSGGPVTGGTASPQTGTTAAGIISGIQNGTPICNGVVGSGSETGRKCSATVFIAPVYNALAGIGYGATIMTNSNYNQ